MKVYSVYYKKDDGSKTSEDIRAPHILMAVPLLAMKLRISLASLVRTVWAIVDVEENSKKPDEPEEGHSKRHR